MINSEHISLATAVRLITVKPSVTTQMSPLAARNFPGHLASKLYQLSKGVYAYVVGYSFNKTSILIFWFSIRRCLD